MIRTKLAFWCLAAKSAFARVRAWEMWDLRPSVVFRSAMVERRVVCVVLSGVVWMCGAPSPSVGSWEDEELMRQESKKLSPFSFLRSYRGQYADVILV